MHPILFRIPIPGFPIPIYSYGVMLGLSLVVGWYLTLGLAERDGLPKDTMANNYVFTAIAAVVGARLLYILTNLNEFDTFASIFAMRRGGLVAYGGFLGGFVGSYFFLRRHRIPLLPWADVAVPSLASGLMITRVGCYLFGCDFGRPLSENAPAFLKTLGSFPHWPEGTLDQGSGSPAWVQHVKERGLSATADFSLPVHPTQIYESLVGAGLLVFLLLMRKKQTFRGQIFFLFTFAYGVCRYLLEIVRDDAERGSIPPSLPQHILIPLGLFVLSIGYVIGFSKMVQNPTVRRVTQGLAILAPIALYLVMKPETFANVANIEFSTSQAVAIGSGLAASIAFSVFYTAALDHPEAAMALHLPEVATPGAAPPEEEEDDEDDEDEDEADAAPKKKAATAKKKAPVSADDADESAPKKKVATKRPASKKASAKSKATAPKADAEADEKPEAPAEAADDATKEPAADEAEDK